MSKGLTKHIAWLRIISVIILLMPVGFVAAQEVALPDTTVTQTKKESLWKRFINQLIGGNKDRTFEQPMDVSFAISPSYTRESSFGIGGMVTGLYRIDRTDSVMQPSDVSLIANASFTGSYNFSLKGNNNFNRKSRLTYNVDFSNKPLDFWGITYDDCERNHVINYTRQQLKFDVDYTYRLTDNCYWGAVLDFNYSNITHIDSISYLRGQSPSYILAGLGITLQYDSRDFVLNPRRGLYIMLRGVVYPSVMGNSGKTVYSTTLIADYYLPIWKGATLALDLYAQYNGTDAPWPLRAELGSGGSRMRGYYGGRYIDNNQVNFQAEIRQHIYSRLGCVVWVGTGTVFPSFQQFNWSHLKFNYGVGLRFEFKHNVNVRVDYGFGRHTGGFVFSIGEAF